MYKLTEILFICKDNMSGRKPVIRSLPALANLVNRASLDHQHKLHAIETALRQVIPQIRNVHRVPFYSMRTVAEYFQVNLSTVATVYERLEKAGLLTRVRSSQTFVEGRRAKTRSLVRGVIAVPIWLPGFLAFHDWRQFFITLEDRLRTHNFAPVLIFHRLNESNHPAFVDRVLAHRPDKVIWFLPTQTQQMNIKTLADASLQNILIGGPGCCSYIPTHYSVDLMAGMRRCLADWRGAGITRVILPYHHDTDWFTEGQTLIREAHLTPEPVLHPADEPPVSWLRDLIAPAAAVWWRDDLAWEELCLREPAIMTELFRQTRVVVNHEINIRPGYLTETRVDVVIPDWPAVARRVADDLHTHQLPSLHAPAEIGVRYHSQVPATDYAQQYRRG